MLVQLIFLLLATAITFALYPFWINFVYKYQLGEKIRNDGPQTHLKKQGTPTMGGLVFLLVVSLLTLFLNKSRTQTLFPLVVISMAGLFGVMEDVTKVYRRSGLKEAPFFSFLKNLVLFPFRKIWPINKLMAFFIEASRILGSSSGRGIQTYQKFIAQAIIAGFVSYWTYFKLGWDYIWMPLIGDVHIGFLYPVIIFVMFLAVLNFVAFTDGIDGLAGGLALIAFIAYWFIASHLEYNSLATLAATFVGVLLPFLYFNIYPARIFMGDVGSHVLGAALAIFAIIMHREIAMLFILIIFLADGVSSPLQQLSVVFTKKRLFRMAPLHHHFELLGWPETKVTLRFWLFGSLFAFIGMLISMM